MNDKNTAAPISACIQMALCDRHFVLLAVDLANLYIPQFIGEIIDGSLQESLIWRAWAALYLRY